MWAWTAGAEFGRLFERVVKRLSPSLPNDLLRRSLVNLIGETLHKLAHMKHDAFGLVFVIVNSSMRNVVSIGVFERAEFS